MKQNGFVISVDALLALFVLFMMIGIAFEGLSTESSRGGQHTQLEAQAYYTALTLEQSRIIPRAVISNNSTEIRNFLDSWPANLCGSVVVFPSPDNNLPLMVVTKTSCTSVTGIEESARTGVMVPSPPDVNVYPVVVSTWVNQA